MYYAPHHLASQGASPRGEALTKEGLPIFAEENIVSKLKQGGDYIKGNDIEIKRLDMKKTVFGCPSSVCYRRHLPPRGKANFCCIY